MEKKQKSSYVAVFRYIKETFKISFDEIMTDFELGLKNAAREVFGDATLLSCWFHYCQAINRQFQKLPNSVRFSSAVKEFISKFMALPLAPPDRIAEGYFILKNEILSRHVGSFAKHFRTFFSYYESFWLDRIGPYNYTVFSIAQRTNNNNEQFNKLLNAAIKTNHPNIWKFMGNISIFRGAKFVSQYFFFNRKTCHIHQEEKC